VKRFLQIALARIALLTPVGLFTQAADRAGRARTQGH
jgi:hypothetical protein